MNAPQPMAARPLALLTLAVLGAHLLVLSTPLLRESPAPVTVRTLLTRVLDAPRESEVGPVDRQSAPVPRVLPIPRLQRPANAARVAAPASLIDSRPVSPPAPEATPAMALAIPGPVRLNYAVTGQSRGRTFAVDGQLLWRHDGNQYEARLDYAAPLRLSRSQSSSGRITAEGLAPQRFSDRSRSEQATHFERESNLLVFSNNAPAQPLQPGLQDRLSVFLQLAAMLAAEPAKFPPGTAISVHTAGSRDASAWLFTVEADEALDLPGGRVATRKLVRQPRGEYDIRIELWLGTGMDYVPVRIRLTQPNGDFVDQQWSSTDRS
jgi:hypothetical protein